MTPEQWQQVKAVLAAALERAPDERDDYLTQVCAEQSMRCEVESLLAAHHQAGSGFLGLPDGELDVLTNGTRLGPYEILAPLGEGGMGKVYKARDSRLDRFVAIKLLRGDLVDRPEINDRFVREARTIASLNHPHICTLHDVGHQGNADFLVMEYLEGETLAQRLESGPLPLEQALQFAVEIADALDKAHSQGVTHRDLKPGNIMLTSGGSKLLDFGLAKLRRQSGPFAVLSDLPAPAESISAPGEILGTLSYMAPEQLEGREVDARTDIFAFGTVVYEMVSGKKAFGGQGGAAVIAAILKEAPPPLSRSNARGPAELKRIVAKMLAKNPNDRYATAAEILVDLRALQRLLKEPSSLRSVRHARLAPAIAVGGIVVVTLAVFFLVSPQARQRFASWFRTTPLPREKLVAVLPFTVVSSDAKEKPFSDGLTETLTAKLTQLTVDPTLQVVPAPEIRARGTSTIDDVRKEFGVTLVVEGNLQRSGDQVRINIALVDAGTHRQLRAESLTIAASDPFAVQDQVVNATVGMLQVEVQPSEREALQTHGTEVASAYDFYLQGLGYLQNYDKMENIESAIKVFDTALQLDPRYALAYAGRGDAYWKMYEGSKAAPWIENSRRDCERAIELDRALLAGHTCLGRLYKGTGRYQEAVAEFERAIEAEPTDDDAYRELAEAYQQLGKSGQAEATYRRAIDLRPQYWAGYNWLGVFYYHRAQYAEAAAMFEQVSALAPDNAIGLYNLGTSYVGEGRYTDAIAVLERSITMRPSGIGFTDLGNAYFYLRRYDEATRSYEQAVKLNQAEALLWWNLGDGYYWTPGRRAQAVEAYRHAVSVATGNLRVNPKDTYALGILAICDAMLGEKKPALESLRKGLELTPADPEMLFKAALIYNHFGDVPQGLIWLERALSEGFSQTIVRDTPDFDQLHAEPHFQELLRPK